MTSSWDMICPSAPSGVLLSNNTLRRSISSSPLPSSIRRWAAATMSSPILLIVVVADLNSRFDFVGCKANQDGEGIRGEGRTIRLRIGNHTLRNSRTLKLRTTLKSW